jgi:hypothetical protein
MVSSNQSEFLSFKLIRGGERQVFSINNVFNFPIKIVIKIPVKEHLNGYEHYYISYNKLNFLSKIPYAAI